MAGVTVTVTLGREKIEITSSEEMTFGDLRRILEERAGAVDGGLRLLHKGKSFPDGEMLKNVGVKTGTKMMALRTKKQIDAEKDHEKRLKLSHDRATMSEMRERAASGAGSASDKAMETKQVILGDIDIKGQTCVIVIKGRSKFRVNIDFSASVQSLQKKVSSLEGIDSEPRDMKFLHKGKVLEDGKNLSDYEMKDGSSLMLLFSARYHDAKDDCAEIEAIACKVIALEVKARKLVSNAKHRLLDRVSLSIARGEVEEELLRLKDNLDCMKSEDERKPEIQEKLSNITSMLTSLQ